MRFSPLMLALMLHAVHGWALRHRALTSRSERRYTRLLSSRVGPTGAPYARAGS